MKSRLVVYLLVGIVGVGALVWFYLLEPQLSNDGGSDLYVASQRVTPENWRWPNEEAWIVSMTAQHLGKLAGKEVELKPTNDGYVAEFDGESISISLQPHLWAVDAFLPLAEALDFGADSGGEGKPDLLRELLTPSAENLQSANVAVSRNLAEHPRSAAAHEDAAMLLASFGLKEGAGCFYDARETLSRLTAHLAAARALRGDVKSGDSGLIATILHEGLAGRSKAADELVEAQLTNAEDDLAIWRRVILTRIHSDWRLAEADFDAGSLTELERIEYLRALRIRVSDNLAIQKIREIDPLPLFSDYSRLLVNESSYLNFSVDSGWFIMRFGIGAELAEAAGAFELESGDELPVEAALQRIVSPNQESEPRVISEQMWASHVERHLIQTIASASYFMEHKLGDPDGHSEFLRDTRELVEDLPLFAMIGADWPRWDKKRTLDFVRENPERVPAQAWIDWVGKRGSKDWFNSRIPIGTAYNATHRRELFGTGSPWLETQHALYDVAPSSSFVCYQLAGSDADRYNNIEELYGDYMDITADGLSIAATKAGWKDQDAYLDLLKRAARLDAQKWLKVGRLAAISGDRELAAEAYGNAFEQAPGRVHVSNEMSWYVLDLLEQGDKARARAVAEDVAEVYSYRGLLVMMWYQANEGDFRKAFEYASRIRERYDDAEPWLQLWGHFPKQVEREPDTEKLVAAAKAYYAEHFPDGREKYDPATQADPPNAGVRLVDAGDPNDQSPYMAFYGVRNNDVIVAVDGFVVENQAQYLAITETNYFQKNHPIVIWRKGEYLTMEADLPLRKFGCDLKDWKRSS